MAGVIALLAVVAFALPLAVASYRAQRDAALTELEAWQRQAAAGVSSDALRGDPVELPAAPAGVRFSVVSGSGTLLAGEATGPGGRRPGSRHVPGGHRLGPLRGDPAGRRPGARR